jgi:hypothetical protein
MPASVPMRIVFKVPPTRTTIREWVSSEQTSHLEFIGNLFSN